mgnify:CR=1 FL=1
MYRKALDELKEWKASAGRSGKCFFLFSRSNKETEAEKP